MDVTNELSKKRKCDAEEAKDKRKRDDERARYLEKELWTKSSRETCPICLNPTEKKLLGFPNNCRHRFCLRCLRKWSKRKNTCPVCRTEYKSIVGMFSIIYFN